MQETVSAAKDKKSFPGLIGTMPDHAQDLAKNLVLLAEETLLSPQQKAGAFLVAALAVRNDRLVRAMIAEFGATFSPEAMQAVKTIAAIMPVYNLYYRFAGLTGASEYDEMPLKLRLSSLSRITLPELDRELWIVAISAINGCGGCLKSHEPAAREAGASAEQIQAVVRIAAVIYATATVLDSGI